MAIRRRNPNIRFYIAIAVILLLIGALLFVILYSGTEEITERGVIQLDYSTSAVVIRDETTYVAPAFTRIEYGAHEGDTVAAGDELATVYRLGYNDELMVSLLDDREQVYREQINLIGSAKDERLEELESDINALQSRIASSVMGSSGEDLASLQAQLAEALTARREYLTKVQAKETLTSLYAKEANQMDIISRWTETVVSDGGGIVSYYFDGYEQAVNAQKLELLSSDLLRSVLRGKGISSWTTDDNTRVCRVVDPGHWYIAFVVKNDQLIRVAKGVQYGFDVEGAGSFTGTALEPVISGEYTINILEVNSDIGRLIDARTAKIKLTSAVTGIKVKADAIKEENNNFYLELVLSESHYKMRVDIIAWEKDYVIVRPHDSGESLNEGVRYWKK